VVNKHSTNWSKTYNSLVFSTKLHKNSWKNSFLDGMTTWRHKCKVNHLNQELSTKCIGRWFLTTNKPKSCKKQVCYTSSFLKGSLEQKKLEVLFSKHIRSFLCWLYLQTIFHRILYFFLKFPCKQCMFYIHMFF
jgi:hypothetical protein